MKQFCVVIFLAITALLVAGQTPQQDTERFDQYGRWIHGEGEPWSMDSNTYTSEQAKTFRGRWANLDKTTKETTDEWAGEYFLPGLETSVVSLRWTNENGFAFLHANTCMAAVVNLSYGGVYSDSAEVMLLPEIDIVSSEKRDEFFLDMLRTKYIPVKWDGVHYLVPEKDMRTFFDMFSGRLIQKEDDQPQFVRFFRKSGDTADHDSMDNMVVPYGYDKFVRKPITAVITKVGKEIIKNGDEENDSDQQFLITPVVINAGSAKGVKVGMTFSILSAEDGQMVEIKKVFKDHSTGVIVKQIDDDDTESDEGSEKPQQIKISVGSKLTTFAPYAGY